MKSALIITAAILAFAMPASTAFAQGVAAVTQDFEKESAGGPSFSPVWNCIGEVQSQKVHGGKQALRMQVAQDGGTIAIHFPTQTADLSKAKKITLWILDEQGDNNVELRLRDAHGNGGSGTDGKAVWSETKAKQNAWTQIEWDLAKYPSADGLDKTQIRSIEIYEYLPGAYFIDDLVVE